jgi:hypothetical protein
MYHSISLPFFKTRFLKYMKINLKGYSLSLSSLLYLPFTIEVVISHTNCFQPIIINNNKNINNSVVVSPLVVITTFGRWMVQMLTTLWYGSATTALTMARSSSLVQVLMETLQ